MCCESWGVLCRCCAACWKTAPSLLQLQWCCPLRLLRFCCWCPIACVNCCCCAAAAAAAAAWWSKIYCMTLSICAVAMASYVCQSRVLSYQCGTLFIYSHLHQVANTTRSRLVACAHIVMWTTSCTFESLTLHHCASPPTQPIVLIHVCVSLLEATDFSNPSDDTTASADMRSPAYCCYRCVASAATRSGAGCRSHSAAAVSLCRSVSADPSASPCTPWIVLHLLPDLFVLDRVSSNAIANSPLRSTDTTRDGSVPPRLSHVPPRAKLTPRGLRSSRQVRPRGCCSSPSPTTHVHSSISHNVLPFIRCSAKFRSPGTRCIKTLPDFVTRNHSYFSSICRSFRGRSFMRLL